MYIFCQGFSEDLPHPTARSFMQGLLVELDMKNKVKSKGPNCLVPMKVKIKSLQL